ncbi:unnamed protein product, partial [marine sediment metagenome]
KDCEALVAPDDPILWLRGQFCSDPDLVCPFYACLVHEGTCTIPHEGVGCEDPWCCTDVCDFDPWCCTVEWDEVCVRWSQELCYYTPPLNDSCFEPVPDDGGVLLVDVNSSTVIGTTGATEEAADPGFCCHEGADCPGGMCCHPGNEECYPSQYGLCVEGERDWKPCDPDLYGTGPGSRALGTVW